MTTTFAVTHQRVVHRLWRHQPSDDESLQGPVHGPAIDRPQIEQGPQGITDRYTLYLVNMQVHRVERSVHTHSVELHDRASVGAQDIDWFDADHVGPPQKGGGPVTGHCPFPHGGHPGRDSGDWIEHPTRRDSHTGMHFMDQP